MPVLSLSKGHPALHSLIQRHLPHEQLARRHPAQFENSPIRNINILRLGIYTLILCQSQGEFTGIISKVAGLPSTVLHRGNIISPLKLSAARDHPVCQFEHRPLEYTWLIDAGFADQPHDPCLLDHSLMVIFTDLLILLIQPVVHFDSFGKAISNRCPEYSPYPKVRVKSQKSQVLKVYKTLDSLV